MNRRNFLQIASTAAGGAMALPAGAAGSAGGIEAVAFDGLAVFDLRPIGALAERLFPGQGSELVKAWRTRQFEYTWLRTMMNRYADFRQVTEEALVFAAATLKVPLDSARREELMHAFSAIQAWPDAPKVLRQLRDSGLRMALLSNFTAQMLDQAVANSKLEGVFEPHLSTDLARAYKPDPRAYRLGVDAFGKAPARIAFVAFAGWDAAGAKAFGYPTYWANRLGLPVEELGVAADAVAPGLEGLVEFVRR